MIPFWANYTIPKNITVIGEIIAYLEARIRLWTATICDANMVSKKSLGFICSIKKIGG